MTATELRVTEVNAEVDAAVAMKERLEKECGSQLRADVKDIQA